MMCWMSAVGSRNQSRKGKGKEALPLLHLHLPLLQLLVEGWWELLLVGLDGLVGNEREGSGERVRVREGRGLGLKS